VVASSPFQRACVPGRIGRPLPHSLLRRNNAAFRPASAQAQVTIDMSKISYEQFLLFKMADPNYISIWLTVTNWAKRVAPSMNHSPGKSLCRSFRPF
jgi:hypothetical protein